MYTYYVEAQRQTKAKLSAGRRTEIYLVRTQDSYYLTFALTMTLS